MKNPSRRDLIKTVGLGTLGLALPGCVSKSQKPNIIFIMADDLGYGDLGCYGQKEIMTPNIDSLAEQGTRFTQCYAGSPVCAPSRSALMTGQHLGQTRVRGNTGKAGGVVITDNGPPQRRVPLELEDVTVAEVLKTAGYTTGMTGKWGLGEPGTPGIPTKQGFDEWFGYLNQRRAHNYYPEFLWKNENKFLLHKNKEGNQETYSHDLFTEFALDFIKQHKQAPFFLYLPYTIPHAKYHIPSTDPYSEKPWEEKEKVHAAMVTRMDRDIGKIVALLKDLDLDKNTIIFFCSDNGAAKRWEGRFDSSGLLRGQKRDLYEGGIRTPMIVHWPDHVPKGSVSDLVWYFPDVLPTLADLAGASLPENIDGTSVLPTLLGEKQDLGNRFLYWEFHEREFQQAARFNDWKALRLSKDGPIELYDLAGDLGEEENIADRHPEIVRKFEEYFRTARIESANWPVG
jgi:arylsulfatase A-like enzyme